MKEFFISIVIAITFLIIGFEFKEAKCVEKYSEYEPQFGILSGCRVAWEGKLTPVENIGYRDMQ